MKCTKPSTREKDVPFSKKMAKHLGNRDSRGLPDPALRSGAENAILKLARVLARQAAREDHAQNQVRSACDDQTGSDIRKVFD